MTVEAQISQAQVLFVDDERPILNSLKRLFRPTNHKIHIANSGSEGLSLLESNDIDVVISDMRMPSMDGAEFLGAVAERWPDTARMLLTGYADLSSAIDAINSGAISRYLTKPWQDDDIVLCIEQAIESKRLREEKRQLEALITAQNEELQALNESLEEKVARRTQAVEAAKQEISVAHEALQAGYSATIEVFARLIQSRAGLQYGANVAEDSRAVAAAMNLDEEQQHTLYEAALLCDVGKLSLPDHHVEASYTALSAPEQRTYQRHPSIAETTLITLEKLSDAAAIIRTHMERLDGSGFPDKLKGADIPLSARILCVTKTYADLLAGRWFPEELTVNEARDYLEEHAGSLFDEAVVEHFLKWLNTRARKAKEQGERKTTLGGLRAGLMVSRDLHDSGNVLILGAGNRVSDKLIDQLEKLQESFGETFTIYVKERL